MMTSESYFSVLFSHYLLLLSDPLNGIASYCATICCDSTEEMCLDYDEDGKVNQYCAAVCSLFSTVDISQLMQFFSQTIVVVKPKFVEGGCPCPQGQEKCGAGETLSGIESIFWFNKYWIAAVWFNFDRSTERCYRLLRDGLLRQWERTNVLGLWWWWIYDSILRSGKLFSPSRKLYTHELWCASSHTAPFWIAQFAEGGCSCPEGEKKCYGKQPFSTIHSMFWKPSMMLII